LRTAAIEGTFAGMSRFENVGKALRLIRERQGLSQKDLAAKAGITSAMLSNYETGEKKPSIDSLGKVVEALGLYMGKLDDALDMVNDRPLKRDRLGYAIEAASGLPGAEGLDVRGFLGAEVQLPPDLEKGFVEMIAGFRHIARYLYSQMRDVGRRGFG
jgi:transcriptional regulator with XRE-family HTH domain